MEEKVCKYKIKYYRQLRNMTQQELAHSLGTDARNIRRWENGENVPNVNDAIRIAEILDVPFQEIFMV